MDPYPEAVHALNHASGALLGTLVHPVAARPATAAACEDDQAFDVVERNPVDRTGVRGGGREGVLVLGFAADDKRLAGDPFDFDAFEQGGPTELHKDEFVLELGGNQSRELTLFDSLEGLKRIAGLPAEWGRRHWLGFLLGVRLVFGLVTQGHGVCSCNKNNGGDI
jgi:hypothetical protein